LKVKILKPIFIEGKPKKPGETIEVPDVLGHELVYSGKCVKVGSEKAEVPEEPKKEKSKK
jgi:hypothetical protein